MWREGAIVDGSEAQAFAEAEAQVRALLRRWNGNQRSAEERDGGRHGDEDGLEGHDASVAREHGVSLGMKSLSEYEGVKQLLCRPLRHPRAFCSRTMSFG
jgi:hypothetical protein